MAFGGAVTAIPAPPTGEGPQVQDMTILGLTLAVFAAAPAAIANADTGELTTSQAPAANQTALPATFGKGPGNWVAGDEALVDVVVQDDADTTQGGAGQLPSPHVAIVAGARVTLAAGNLVIRVHNRGLVACAQLRIGLRYKHSIVR